MAVDKLQDTLVVQDFKATLLHQAVHLHHQVLHQDLLLL